MKYLDVEKYLIDNIDLGYKSFNEKLIPQAKNILGVRLPILRTLAKNIATNDYNLFFDENEYNYYEDFMLQGLVISYLNIDLEEILKLIENFIPKIDNWAVCDSFCNSLKIVELNDKIFWSFLKTYFNSNLTYYNRFAVVLSLNFFILSNYIDELFERILNIQNNDDYYVDMAIAWALSISFIKFKDKTIDLLSSNLLSQSIQNKTIKKIRDSKKVSPLDKEIIKEYKR